MKPMFVPRISASAPKLKNESSSSSSFLSPSPTSGYLSPMSSANPVHGEGDVVASSESTKKTEIKNFKRAISDSDKNEQTNAMVSKKSKKGRKVKQLKDPLAPKKPKSPFMLFSDDMRPTIREELGNLSLGNMGKELGRRWGEIGDDVKIKYTEAHAALKEEYEREMENYSPSNDFLELKEAHDKENQNSKETDVMDYFNFVGQNWHRIQKANGKEVQDILWDMWLKMPSGKKGKNLVSLNKVKKVKDPNAPKKPPNAYFLFQTEMREQMKKKVDVGGAAQVDNKQFMSSVADQWKAMDQEQKQPFLDQQEILKAEYKVAMENYEKD